MPTMILTTEDAVTLPGMGMVTGTIIYSNGCSATREDPGEEAGIEDLALKDAFGIDLDPEMILEVAARYTALEAAVWEILSAQDAADYADYASEREARVRVGEHRDIHYW